MVGRDDRMVFEQLGLSQVRQVNAGRLVGERTVGTNGCVGQTSETR